MKKLRRIVSILLACMMLLAISGCQQQIPASGQEQQPDASTAQQEEQSAPAEASPPESTDEEGIVQTNAGRIQGTDQDGVFRFLGIPYAQARERFVPAGEVEPWEGVLVADSFGPMSPQASFMAGAGSGMDQAETDNNSQNLNIWTPGIDDGAARPVMVWLHGGGFSMGTANEEGSDGEALSRGGDVVVVSINHRLNVFGHLDLSAYGEKYRYSANVGISDIEAALRWIQENIASFGGDPGNITLFGQSGGGAKILALMTTPNAKGLFHRGIVQSGATETVGVAFNTQEASTQLTQNLLEILEIDAENIEEIQNVSVEDLLAASAEALQQSAEALRIPTSLGDAYAMEWQPVVDGDYLPTHPVTEESFAAAGARIPLLIGSNLNEWTGFFPADPVEPSEALTDALRAAYPDKPDLTVDQVDSATIRLPLLKIMSHKAAQNGAPVYSYVFTYGQSYHGAEIPYVFNHADGSAEERALAAQISQAWVNFARTGTPGAEGLPEWEPYTRDSGATMLLDSESRIAYHHDRDLMHLLAPDYPYDE